MCTDDHKLLSTNEKNVGCSIRPEYNVQILDKSITFNKLNMTEFF